MAGFDVGNRIDLGRLHKAIGTSRDALRPFRGSRTEMIRDYVGSWYSSSGARFLTYVNKLNQTAGIYTMALAFNNPQVKIDSFDFRLWPFCRKYQVNVNKVIANIDLKTTLQAATLDAFFLMGICKVYMADAGEVQLDDNVWVDPGKPWVSRISPDDAILDMAVKDIRAMRFCGDRYRVPYWKISERDDFERRVVAHVSPTSKAATQEGSERASEIASGMAVDDDELEPMVWLEDVYLPETRRLVTFAADNTDLPPLKVGDRRDSPQGPYKHLSLGLVPDNIIPSTPAHHLKALHDLSNRLYRKLSAQAAQQKNTIAYPPGSEDDAKRHKEAKNGEYWKCRDPKSISPVNTPGVDGNTHAFFLAAQEIYNVQSGNERVIGGLSSEAETLGQAEMERGGAVGRIAHMKGAVNCWAGDIAREMGGLMFDDEALTVSSSMEAENTGFFVDTSWRPGEREGLKDHYDFSVEPNSMGYQPPEAKLQRIFAFVEKVGKVYPMVQAGILDVQELTRIASEYENIPELQRIFKYMTPEMLGGPGGDPHQATKAPVTSRETVRTNRSQGPQGQGMAAVLGQMMQGRGQGQNGT
ncbi:MAG TPA: hypothetical protein VNA25_22845 [Phycisphaerae bacterium]|nr:hypothetical protein [Phycisphaerae bacterium]